jgi:hypothetical protein
MIGAGKYDDALTEARKMCGASAALLIVLDGEKGAGFSCQSTPTHLLKLPTLLRQVAGQIEADLRKGIL